MTDSTLDPHQLPQAQLFLDQADRRLASYDRRFSSTNTGLGTLVGTAAIAASLATTGRHDGWVLAALACTALAAVLGVFGLAPRQSNELPMDELRQELFARDEATATLHLADRRAGLAADNESRITAKARILRAGLIALVAAIVFLLLSATGLQVTLQ